MINSRATEPGGNCGDSDVNMAIEPLIEKARVYTAYIIIYFIYWFIHIP